MQRTFKPPASPPDNCYRKRCLKDAEFACLGLRRVSSSDTHSLSLSPFMHANRECVRVIVGPRPRTPSPYGAHRSLRTVPSRNVGCRENLPPVAALAARRQCHHAASLQTILWSSSKISILTEKKKISWTFERNCGNVGIPSAKSSTRYRATTHTGPLSRTGKWT
ncbi:hypothetical protein CLAIMM_12504 [Cladophialophora immunda]|nr:hypothetical protein CLAIMM_12504 [Cladophialophora immunda]